MAGVSAGYSGTPLTKKLGIKAGFTVALLDKPPDFRLLFEDLPEGVQFTQELKAPCDLVLWFVRNRNDLEAGISQVSQDFGKTGVWIIWPKKASGIQTDLGEADVRAAGLSHGLVDYKVSAIDSTWSGLKFARRKNRSK
jgi:hypothetical protein